MPIGLQNMDINARGAIAGSYPDIGQTMYLVHSDYRTAAQGWSKADRTGPLDLAEARRAGPGGVQYVFRTLDYATHTLAMQAHHDASVAFRGDALFFTPGNYTPLTAVTYSNAAVRLLGQPRGRWSGNTTITAGVAQGVTIGTTAQVGTPDVEIGFLRFVPLTAAATIAVQGASNNLWLHDWTYDARGITANTATVGVLFNGTTSPPLNSMIERFHWMGDAAQGPYLKWIAASAMSAIVRDGLIVQSLGTLASCINAVSTTLVDLLVADIVGIATNGAAVTNFLTVGDNAINTVDVVVMNCRLSKGFPTAAALITGFGVAAENNVMDCRLGQDGATAAATTTSTSTIYTQ